MTRLRPDLIPLGKITQFGCPYHGRVVGGQLTLPNATTITYPQPSTGEAVLVRHPLASAPTPTAADTAAGYQWLDYALLSGGSRQICGQKLNDLAPSGSVAMWLYCDAVNTWVVSCIFTKSVPDQTLTVKLIAPFGIVRDKPPTMTARTLGTYNWTPKQYDGSDQTSAQAAHDRNLRITHSQTGAVTAVNIGATPSVGVNPWLSTAISEYQPSQVIIGYHDAIKITLSGNGSVAAGHVGEGISVAFTHLATAPEMYSFTSEFSNYLCPPGSGGEPGPSLAQNYDEEELVNTYYCAKPDGTITHLEKSKVNATTYTYENPQCNPTIGYDSVTVDTTMDWSWSFGGVTYTSNAATDPFDEYGAHPGILTIENDDDSSATIVTMTGVTKDVTGYSYLPKLDNLAWNPATGAIEFGDDQDPGCWV